MIQISSKKHVSYFKSYLSADSTGYFIIITCKDFGSHTVGFQCFDRICCGFLGRIKECKITDQHHITLIFYTKSSNRRRMTLLCNGKHTESLVIQFIYGFKDTLTNRLRKRLHSAITLCIGTDGKHLLYCTFCYHLRLALFILYNCCQAAACEIKRDLIYLHIVFGQIQQLRIFCLFFLCSLNDCQIHQVFIARLEIAV